MARTVTLADMRTKARQRADMVGSNFVSDSELDGYLNSAISELYDLLVRNYGEEYFTSTTPHSITTVSGTEMYDLPDDFYKLVGVDVSVGGRWVGLNKYTFKERNRGQDGSLVREAKYRLHGTQIRFTPAPSGSHSVRLWYVAAPAVLSEDEDTFDGISGWEEYVIVTAAMKMLTKEESDVRDLEKEQAKLLARIEVASANRDIAEPERISDVDAEDDDPDYTYGVW